MLVATDSKQALKRSKRSFLICSKACLAFLALFRAASNSAQFRGRETRQVLCATSRFVASLSAPPPIGSPSLVSWNLSLTLSSFSMAFMLGALILCRMLCCSLRRCCSVLVSALISSSESASWSRGQMSTLFIGLWREMGDLSHMT